MHIRDGHQAHQYVHLQHHPHPQQLQQPQGHGVPPAPAPSPNPAASNVSMDLLHSSTANEQANMRQFGLDLPLDLPNHGQQQQQQQEMQAVLGSRVGSVSPSGSAPPTQPGMSNGSRQQQQHVSQRMGMSRMLSASDAAAQGMGDAQHGTQDRNSGAAQMLNSTSSPGSLRSTRNPRTVGGSWLYADNFASKRTGADILHLCPRCSPLHRGRARLRRSWRMEWACPRARECP